MAKPQTVSNPFYVVLVIAGICFVVTACAYFTMALREADGTAAAAHGLTALLSRHGLTVLIAELVVLAIATFAAMSTDDYWSRRNRTGGPMADITEGSDGTNGTDQSKASSPSLTDRG